MPEYEGIHVASPNDSFRNSEDASLANQFLPEAVPHHTHSTRAERCHTIFLPSPEEKPSQSQAEEITSRGGEGATLSTDKTSQGRGCQGKGEEICISGAATRCQPQPGKEK